MHAAAPAALIGLALLTTTALATDIPTIVLNALPADYRLAAGQSVYVENDGRCPSDEVMQVAGTGIRPEDMPKISCVARPR